MMRGLLLLAVLSACADAGARAPAPSEAVNYGLFGNLHLARPAAASNAMVLQFSDADGWNAREESIAGSIATQGALVVGIDTPAYLKRLQAIDDKCSYPAGHVEEVAHWIARHENIAQYAAPLVIGDGVGATFAYAMSAQAPAGTFSGLITLGWDEALRLAKPLCAGDAGAITTADGAGRFRVVPVTAMPLPWWPRLFAPGARSDGLGAWLAAVWRVTAWLCPMSTSVDAADDAARIWLDWQRQQSASAPALPDDVADLPLTEVAPTITANGRVAILVTGDGGWAGLDRGVAEALAAQGVRVVGFSTLKFFWHTQTPQAAADAIARVIAHYGKDAANTRFVLVGYSFGASLVPVILNRLPPALRARIELGVMISPDDEAVFEIHVGDWFGSTHHEGALPLVPELARSQVSLLCVHGADEDDSPCSGPLPVRVRAAALPGGHHYDGDYAALGALISRALTAVTSR
ncbi:MAG: virulence factor family protein [Dokdonella sp.]|nr:virulence factor family protein [Dokdonella sp.]